MHMILILSSIHDKLVSFNINTLFLYILGLRILDLETKKWRKYEFRVN